MLVKRSRRSACPSAWRRFRPASTAMLCETPDMFDILIVTGPGVARRLVGHVGELTGRGWRRSQLAGLLDRGLAGARRFDGGGEQPGVLARAGDRPGDVGGDVLERRSAGEILRHRAFGVGDADLVFHDAAHGAALSPSARLARKASSRFGPTIALGVGAGERVAGAALGDERLLAEDQVGVVGALDRAARARRAPARRAAQPAPQRARERRAAPCGAAVAGSAQGLAELMSGRNTIRTGGALDGRVAAPPRVAALTAPARPSSSPARRGEHPARDALPGPALADRLDEPRARLARAAPDRPAASPIRRAASAAHGVVVEREGQPRGGLRRDGARRARRSPRRGPSGPR